MKKEWSIQKALFVLVGSTVCTLTLSLIILFSWQKKRAERLENECYHVRYILQTGPEKKALPTAHLAEILGLCKDLPISLYALDMKDLKKRLLQSPFIAKANVKRLPPSTLYIDYEIRKPVAWISDFKNRAVDQEGYLFPIHPFFSPKQLPEIYLGISDLSSSRIEGAALDLAFRVLKYLEESPWAEGLQVERVDVSHAFSSSLGTREVVILTKEEIGVHKKGRKVSFVFPRILRLTPKGYEEQLTRFFALKKEMIKSYRKQLASYDSGGKFSPKIIDLRAPQLAFIQK